MEKDKILRFKTAITLVLKQLRKDKNVTQASMNADILDNYGFAHNMGRNELEANFTIETLLLYCDYFDVSAVDFFKKVDKVPSEVIDKYLQERKNKRREKK